ncbi:MAG: restriction endonuclease subunit S [Gemmatimonadota bacterium]
MSEEPPEGWTVARLGEVFEVNPRKPSADLLDEHAQVTFIPMAAVDEVAGAITNRDTRAYGEVRKGYTAFAEGDVILAKITPCFENGKVAIATGLENDLGFGSSEFHVLRPLGGVIAKYLYHYLRQPGFREEAANHMTGTAGQERVSVEYVREHEIPIPPVPEQWRIVEKVEALLTQVSSARERLGRVPRLLKWFRQAVLAAACEGRLTEGWREAHRLSDWQSSKLRSVVTLLDQGWSPKCEIEPANSDVAWGVMKTTAVQPMRFLPEENKALPQSLEPRKGLEVRVGDLLITRAGPRARAGVSCLVRATRPRLMICDKVYRFRVDDRIVQPPFVEMYLNTAQMIDVLDSLKTGISDSGVNLTQEKFLDLEITLPDRAEQIEIIRRVESLFSLADTIERRVNGALSRAEKLPQAILSRAFAGELVPTEAESARAEGRTYETAEELLERIRGERDLADRKSPVRMREKDTPRGRLATGRRKPG